MQPGVPSAWCVVHARAALINFERAALGQKPYVQVMDMCLIGGGNASLLSSIHSGGLF